MYELYYNSNIVNQFSSNKHDDANFSMNVLPTIGSNPILWAEQRDSTLK